MNFNGFDFGGLFDIELALENLPFVLEGLPMTLMVSIVGMVMGLIIGLFLALARSSDKIILRWPARIYISFISGTSMIVFFLILYFRCPFILFIFYTVVEASYGFGYTS